MHSSTVTQREERGVYRSWWTRGGFHCLYAVTSTGERLDKLIPLRPGVSEEHARVWFEELLDRVDPVPRIELVTDRHIDRERAARLEALYRDANAVTAALWQRKRERQRGVRAAPLFRDRFRHDDDHPSPP